MSTGDPLSSQALRDGDIGEIPVPAAAWLIVFAFDLLGPWVKRRARA